MFDKVSEFCTTKLKTSDDVFNFLKDTQENFPEHDRDLLLEVMRGAAKCRNCLQVGSKCKDGEEISGSEAPGVLRAGLVVARREPGKSTICGFPCTAESRGIWDKRRWFPGQKGLWTVCLQNDFRPVLCSGASDTTNSW